LHRSQRRFCFQNAGFLAAVAWTYVISLVIVALFDSNDLAASLNHTLSIVHLAGLPISALLAAGLFGTAVLKQTTK